MAKKKSARGEFNMSQEIRALLQENPGLSSREVFEQLQARFPEQTVNRNSCNVAFSHARRRLGIGGRSKKAVKIRRPSARAAAPAASGDSVNIGLLKAARKFLSEAGSSAAAISAIQQVEALQLS
ncbi:hypothetical protein SH661x_000527 [Planctomicrobium sp. SH661]|uniref:hypothetical protein n=1 Tax=Planctomicrobium sp. SH661 TaxID=3448124 RepID=UPI003F5B58EF